ncbi:acyl-CoA dehydrogenase family protein [Nocardioides albidus]|uniref:acyl-CoA dehydrogenase family protein n=1 Tax=Nocardioides albidus TaxID=1517589 RepID=UPI0013052B41|nr:acyl-CoA dehydrogenase family protein [Nocardioides albidus]
MSEATDAIIAQVREMLPDLARDAAAVEINGAVDARVVERLGEIGFFRMLRPQRYGGFEADPVSFFRAVRLLSRSCPATGWIASVLGGHEWHLSLFDDRALAEVWGADPHALLASSYTPDGQLTPTDGGYRLSGRWRTSTGIHHASWAVLGALLLDGNGEPVDFVGALVPAADYRIEERWDPTGLRAVAADGVVVENAFVPSYRTFGARERMLQEDPAWAANVAPLHRMPYSVIHTHAVAVPVIGAAEGAYDALLADHPAAATVPSVARAATDLHVAWRQLTGHLERLLERAERNEPPDTESAIRARRDQSLAAERAVRAIGTFLDAAGPEAWERRHPLQRAWRDAQVAATNAANSVDQTLSIFGRWAYGLDVGDRWW